MSNVEIPVYLFTGFLEAGKTTFMQKTLEDPRFNQGESTLLLLCEEGEEEYDPLNFPARRVFIERIEELEQLTAKRLDELCKKHACERVMVEYNGMWPLDALYSNMPKEWMVYQEFLFADARSFFLYNQNMRERLVDKLRSCEMLVLNRTEEAFDKLALHQLVRAVNRRTDIAYEAPDGSVSYDDLPDELPFDLQAPVIDIAPENYATWYRDISEEMDKYEGKSVRLVGTVVIRPDLPENTFILGRQMMTCCVDDVTFAGLLCVHPNRAGLTHGDWVTLEAKIALRQNKIYGRRGPVLQVLSAKPTVVPEPVVATFY